jgi:hypothetical protein
MTSADRNDQMPAHEKLEWVTPKISLWKAGDTEGNKGDPDCGEGFFDNSGVCFPHISFGPS